MEDKTFLYSVNPKKVIIGLSGVNAIRTPKSLYLTKEDVKICLNKASVYRRFTDCSERVTIANLDRLHNEKHYTEEEWAQVQIDMKSEGHGKVVNNQDSHAEEADLTPAEKDTNEEKEAVVENADNVEEAVEVEESAGQEVTDEVPEVETEETQAEPVKEEVVESEDVSEVEAEQENEDQVVAQNNNTGSSKNKNKRRH